MATDFGGSYMEPAAAAEATREAVVDIPAKFMMDGATYKQGAALGFDGVDFYVAGRGGVLGECDADVVAAAFVWFEPGHVRHGWEAGGKVMARDEAAAAFAGCAHAWAEDHIADGVDAARLADLAGRIVAAASPAGAPLFAGWRLLPVPDSPKAAAVHQLNALRELRGALHGGAVLATGLSPTEALAISAPYMAPIFGWEELPSVEGLADRWQQGEAATNVAMGRAYAVLDSAELDELTSLAKAFGDAVDGQPG